MRVFVLTLLLLLSSLVQARRGFLDGGQEWGYVDVREGAHMFYWLYYVNGGQEPSGKPLVIWLQGGPGASSSSFGNFEEMGPLDLNLKRREKSWVNHVNLLFVDNPVGTGFSFVDKSRYLARDNQQIAADLVQLYLGFLRENPKFKGVPLYVFCESYGGKMTAEFAYELYKEKQRTNNTDINIRGVGLGDGWISGLDSTITWAPYLKQYGLLDERGYNSVDAVAQRCRLAVEGGEWVRATAEWGNAETAVSMAVPGFTADNFYNIYGGRLRPGRGELKAERNASLAALTAAKGMPLSLRAYAVHAGLRSVASTMRRVQDALGLPPRVRHVAQSTPVFNALKGDFMKPVVNVVERLLTETPMEVSVFNGEWDLIVDVIGTLNWVNRLQWPGASQWKAAPQKPITVNGQDNGYSQSWGNFTFYSISRAGHMVPSDNPDAAIAMLRRITHLD
ncbi:retinoid-inducible serine carboxypeptidase-like [Thrips palmi]|uniref:Retinoid-inducible serine carboxypeptidase n=1 Tax=Thrips palmi TaxID=161013 RepID=A0A6P8YM03_THRPL|nr:retinoid-inducible serine carboxypeptidase-like [Thrips palmi]